MGEAAETFTGNVRNSNLNCMYLRWWSHAVATRTIILLQGGEIRLRNAEIVVPIVIGTAAFHLGKKA